MSESARRSNGKTDKAERLSEDQIVDAALAIIRQSGVSGLSMRSLSRELGMSPMAAYYYVHDKQELLDLVAKRALGAIEIPDPSVGPWHLRLRLIVDRVEAELRRNHGIAEVLLDRIMFSQRSVMNAIMEVLEEAGFPGPNIVEGYALIHTYLFGRYRVAIGQADLERNQATDAPVEHHDTVERMAPFVRNLSGRDYYGFGVETLILGLRSQLRIQNLTEEELG